MKKIITIALCVLLLVAIAVPTMAAEETKITVTSSKTVVQRGETVDFTVSVSGDVSYTSVLAEINFDSNVFEYVSGVDKATAGIIVQYDGVSIGLMGVSGTYSGAIQVLTFRVKETAPITASAVTGTAQGTAPDQSPIAVQFVGTSISVDCEHSYPKDPDGQFIYTQEGSNQHKQTCEKCGTPKTEDHDWNDGEGKPGPSCEQGGTIEYTCLICHTTKTEDVGPTGHKYDNNCDSTCNNGCGTTREVSHNYVLVTDKEAHWYKCDCGELKPGSWAKHTPGPAATESSAQVCTVCNYEIAPILSHEHEIGAEWVNDSEAHWHRCEKKGCNFVQDKARHVYDNNCDVTCNVCNAVRKDVPHNYNPSLQANAQGHWQVCASCNAKSEVIEHVPGPEATETEPQRCTECNFIIKMELSHVHDFGDTWYSDDDNHWQSCGECTETTELEAHAWDEGKEQEDGSILYTCTICAKELTRSEPIASEPETTPTTPASSTPKPTTSEEPGGFPWQWAGIAAIVLLLVGVVLLVIEFIRSRKSNMHGKFSK